MIAKILEILKKLNVKEYIINKQITESAELFFVKNSLDMSRAKKVTYYQITVFADGGDLRGESQTVVGPMTDEKELEQKITTCLNSAKSALNPSYDLADKTVGEVFLEKSDLSQNAAKAANAVYSAKSDNSFVNSCEVFAERSTIRTLTSMGTDITYNTESVKGEFVVQAKEPQDVELYVNFEYDKLDENALQELAEESLKTVSSRAVAQKELKSGTYDVVLDGKFIGTLLDLYVDRASANMVYMQYSNYEVGKDVQPNAQGEKLNINLKATRAFSSDGVRMKDRKLLENGVIKNLHGSTRFCRYLKIQPTGVYNAISVDNGSVPLADLLKGNCLYVLAFSDFQCDSFTGKFGGEIRLAYLYDNDGNVKIVTGGSINGNLLKLQDNLTFSLERYNSHSYEGPKAVKIKGVTIAGV